MLVMKGCLSPNTLVDDASNHLCLLSCGPVVRLSRMLETDTLKRIVYRVRLRSVVCILQCQSRLLTSGLDDALPSRQICGVYFLFCRMRRALRRRPWNQCVG